jgi:dCMP deaminase
MINFNDYFMLIALSVRERANCNGSRVGAVIVKDNRIISTGYNGTPERMKNCESGGCIRCKKYRQHGTLYDKCICVHAEQNALITAARFGNSIEGSTVYCTLQPCFSCLKEFLQAKIKTVYYLEELITASDPKDEQEKDFLKQYKILLKAFTQVPTKMKFTDTVCINNMNEYLLRLAKMTKKRKT